jgi:hypothetical protein
LLSIGRCRGLRPIYLLYAFDRALIQLQTFADTAFLQVLDINVRQFQRREILETRRIADAFGCLESISMFHMLDVLHRLDGFAYRCIDPHDSGNRNFAIVRLEKFRNRLTRLQRLDFAWRELNQIGQTGRHVAPARSGSQMASQ